MKEKELKTDEIQNEEVLNQEESLAVEGGAKVIGGDEFTKADDSEGNGWGCDCMC